MSTYKNIKKIPYIDDENKDIVSLKEYMFVESDEEKYLLLRLINKYNDILKSLKLEVYQYNDADEVIEIATFNYDDFSIKYKKDFVPYSKIVVKNECVKVKVKLISATFENYMYENEELKKIEKVKVKTKEIKEKNLRNNGSFTRMSLDIRNIVKTCLLLVIIISALIVCGIFVNNRMLKERDKIVELVDDDFHYIVKSRYEVIIDECYIDDNTITIPKSKHDYKVVGLADNLFKESTIEVIDIKADEISIGNNTFSKCTNLKIFKANKLSEINSHAFFDCISLSTFSVEGIKSIGSYAFSNCIELQNFTYEDTETVKEYAFSDCKKLSSMKFPNAKLYSYCFNNLNGLEEISYGDTSTSSLGNLFGCSNDTISSLLVKITTKQKNISNYFFKNLGYVKEIILENDDSIVKYNAFEGCSNLLDHSLYEEYEVLNNKILSYNQVGEEVDINNKSFSIMNNALYYCGNSVKKINILNDIKITKSFMNNIKNIKEINILGKNTFEKNCFEDCLSMDLITISNTSNNLKELFGSNNRTIKLVKIVGTGDITIDYFNSMYINDIYISSSISNINDKCFKNVYELSSVTLPNIKKFTNYSMPDTLETVTIIKGTSTIIDSDYFYKCKIVKNIIIGTGITSCEERIIKNSDCVVSLTISNDVTSFSLPVIGENCNSLSIVSLPFIGNTVGSNSYYESFNLSYKRTNELSITSNNIILSKLSNEALNNINFLNLNCNVTNVEIFSSFKNLNSLGIGMIKGNHFGSYFNNSNFATDSYVPSNIKTIVLNNCTIPSNYFSNCNNIENIILNNSQLQSNSFASCYNLKNIYISEDSLIGDFAYSISSSYSNYINRINMIYEKECVDDFGYANVSIYKNVDYNNHSYIIEYNENEYVYTGLIITDINSCLKTINNEFNSYVYGYETSAYTNKINSSYFNNSSLKTIYTKDVKYYNVNTYINKSIKIEYYDGTTLLNKIQLNNGDTFIPYIPEKPYYIFSGWYTNYKLEGSSYDFSNSVSNDIKLYAKWKISLVDQIVLNDSVINYSINGTTSKTYGFFSNSVQSFVCNANSNMNINIKLCTETGTELVDKNNELSNNAKIVFQLEKDKIYYIKIQGNTMSDYGQCELIMTFSGNNGSIKFNNNNYELSNTIKIISGESFILDPINIEGYTFKGWYTGEGGTGTKITNEVGKSIVNNIDDDINVYAYFIKN